MSTFHTPWESDLLNRAKRYELFAPQLPAPERADAMRIALNLRSNVAATGAYDELSHGAILERAGLPVQVRREARLAVLAEIERLNSSKGV